MILAGQERFRAITAQYYRGALGAILVYDVTNYLTFKHIGQWLEEIRKNGSPDLCVLLVGNKIDLVHLREVTQKEAETFAKANQLSFIETSALNYVDVDEAFRIIIAGKLKQKVGKSKKKKKLRKKKRKRKTKKKRQN